MRPSVSAFFRGGSGCIFLPRRFLDFRNLALELCSRLLRPISRTLVGRALALSLSSVIFVFPVFRACGFFAQLEGRTRRCTRHTPRVVVPAPQGRVSPWGAPSCAEVWTPPCGQFVCTSLVVVCRVTGALLDRCLGGGRYIGLPPSVPTRARTFSPGSLSLYLFLSLSLFPTCCVRLLGRAGTTALQQFWGTQGRQKNWFSWDFPVFCVCHLLFSLVLCFELALA